MCRASGARWLRQQVQPASERARARVPLPAPTRKHGRGSAAGTRSTSRTTSADTCCPLQKLFSNRSSISEKYCFNLFFGRGSTSIFEGYNHYASFSTAVVLVKNTHAPRMHLGWVTMESSKLVIFQQDFYLSLRNGEVKKRHPWLSMVPSFLPELCASCRFNSIQSPLWCPKFPVPKTSTRTSVIQHTKHAAVKLIWRVSNTLMQKNYVVLCCKLVNLGKKSPTAIYQTILTPIHTLNGLFRIFFFIYYYCNIVYRNWNIV